MIDELPDIPRIYTALAQWLACIVTVQAYDKKRFKGFKLAGVCIFFLAIQSTLLVTTDEVSDNLWLLFMVLSWMLMFALIYCSCDTSMTNACYFSIHAFVLAEFAASLEWQIHCFLWPAGDVPFLQGIALLCVVYAIVFAGAGLIIKRFSLKFMTVNITSRHLIVVAVIAISVFAISNLGFLTTRTPFSGHYHREIFNIRTLMGLCGLLFLGVYNISRLELYVQRELSAVQSVLHSQYEQYQHAKDKQEYINRKYHDLKHQITYLRAEEDPDRRNSFLDSMEREIKEYETKFKTGNPVLDTILTGHGAYCNDNSITLTCVVDGALVNFMDVMDICTVFGNALDNAIEHCKQVEDTEKRLINVKVFSRQDYLVIHFENYMIGKLNFNGKLPVTTKSDIENHGYGLKSIKYVAEKYNGSVSVEENDSWFILQIVIPNE